MKRGQMKLSFGMIFSIILMIIFISFAFFAIKKFVEVGQSTQVLNFVNNLQSDVDKAWRGSQSSQEKEYFLPRSIEFACFVDYSKNALGKDRNLYSELRRTYQEFENLFFYPVGSAQGLDSKEIKHLDLDKITNTNNPFCISNEGKIKITLKKEYGEALVTITE